MIASVAGKMEAAAATAATAVGASSAVGLHQDLHLRPYLAVPWFVGPLLVLGISAAPRAPEGRSRAKLFSLFAPRCFGSHAHGHLLGRACIAVLNCTRASSPQTAKHEAPSIDEQVVDLVYVARCKMRCDSVPGGSEA